jgi:hypothetical protein
MAGGRGVMRKSVLYCCAGVDAGAGVCFAYSQEDMEVVSNEAFDDPQRPPATFYHDTHNEAAGLDDCNECHHIYDEAGVKSEDESSEDQACSECHGDADEGSKPGLMKAYHLNCKGCHLSEKKGADSLRHLPCQVLTDAEPKGGRDAEENYDYR